MEEELSSIFLSPEISIGLFLDFVLLMILSVGFVQSFYFLKKSKTALDSEMSYMLEKKSYLTNTIISTSLIIKIILLIFFIYSLDELATIIPGAMCVTGVLASNIFGSPLLLLKLVILLLISLWLMLSREDMKKKIVYFMIVYLFILVEFILSFYFLGSIDTQTKVSCCSAKFAVVQNPIPFNISASELALYFAGSYLLVLASAVLKKKILLLMTTLLFVYISYYALIYYFGAYIYGDATHKCPYCMLKQEYSFIGYIIYASLFLTLLYSLSIVLFKNTDKYKKVILFSSFVVLILFCYFLVYN